MGSARDNFVRLAEARTRKILKDLDLLGNLSNRSNYAYSEEDVKTIFKAVAKRMQDVELRFKASMTPTRDADFRLPR
ncbi:hypothetical protein CK215_19875 [Mesorhizobium sp. WSM3864]|nr:hypothetical protein CK215_19875 [Mesorhizobium sp. WSM3864]